MKIIDQHIDEVLVRENSDFGKLYVRKETDEEVKWFRPLQWKHSEERVRMPFALEEQFEERFQDLKSYQKNS